MLRSRRDGTLGHGASGVSADIVLLRGWSAAPWDLHPHEQLGPDYRVRVLVPRRNLYATAALGVEQQRARTLSDLMPRGALGRLATRALGERYLGLAAELSGADIVHAAELGNWYSAQAARLKEGSAEDESEEVLDTDLRTRWTPYHSAARSARQVMSPCCDSQNQRV